MPQVEKYCEDISRSMKDSDTMIKLEYMNRDTYVKETTDVNPGVVYSQQSKKSVCE